MFCDHKTHINFGDTESHDKNKAFLKLRNKNALIFVCGALIIHNCDQAKSIHHNKTLLKFTNILYTVILLNYILCLTE